MKKGKEVPIGAEEKDVPVKTEPQENLIIAGAQESFGQKPRCLRFVQANCQCIQQMTWQS